MDEAEKINEPLQKLYLWASVGVDPSLMGLGLEAFARQQKSKLNLDDIDLFEINEAFASQSIAVINELNIDKNKVNVNGAIALGHPIKVSGAEH